MVLTLDADKKAEDFTLDMKKALGILHFTDGSKLESFFSADQRVALIMVDKTWLNLAAERGIALATWGLYPTIVVRGKRAVAREAVAGRRLRQVAADKWRIAAPVGSLASVGAHHPRPGNRARLI